MYQYLKNKLYFTVAGYFRFWAAIRLKKWHPRVIVVTGSSGKTTLLHLIEAQVGPLAKYSHKANSSFGIPFDILGLHRDKDTLDEWPGLFIKAPFMFLTKLPSEKIYIVEADCDRPHEGDFLSSLLKPEVTLWTNVSRTHSMNFDKLVGHSFKTVEEAIRNEFGFFARRTTKLVIPNRNKVQGYTVSLTGTKFKLGKEAFSFTYLLPKEVSGSILMCKELVNYLNLEFDKTFTKFILPPGRNSIFKGIKNITIVDSTYNANFDSMQAVINMFSEIKAPIKWAVLGDMLEQGLSEAEEHRKLARLIAGQNYKRIVLIGPRTAKYTFPELKKLGVKVPIESYINPKDVLNYLLASISGGEVILFKGARFLEGVVANLLADKTDTRFLSRREKIWDIRRKRWGL